VHLQQWRPLTTNNRAYSHSLTHSITKRRIADRAFSVAYRQNWNSCGRRQQHSGAIWSRFFFAPRTDYVTHLWAGCRDYKFCCYRLLLIVACLLNHRVLHSPGLAIGVPPYLLKDTSVWQSTNKYMLVSWKRFKAHHLHNQRGESFYCVSSGVSIEGIEGRLPQERRKISAVKDLSQAQQLIAMYVHLADNRLL